MAEMKKKCYEAAKAKKAEAEKTKTTFTKADFYKAVKECMKVTNSNVIENTLLTGIQVFSIWRLSVQFLALLRFFHLQLFWSKIYTLCCFQPTEEKKTETQSDFRGMTAEERAEFKQKYEEAKKAGKLREFLKVNYLRWQ